MKIPKNKRSKQANYFLPVILLFILFACYLTAMYNREFLMWAAEISLFLPTRFFFLQTMQTAGGLLSYGGTFLTQFFYYPLLGSSILIALLLVVTLLTVKTFNLQQVKHLAIIPALALLLSVTQMGYVLYSLKSPGYLFSSTLGITGCLLLVEGCKAITKRYPAKLFIQWLLPCAVILTYPLLGFYSLFAALLCMLFFPVMFSLLPLLAIVPYLFSHYVYTEMLWSETYTAALPRFFFTSSELPLWIPFFALFFSLLLFPRIPSKIHWSVSWGILFLSFIGVYSLSYKNSNFTTELQMLRAINENDWKQVISIGAKHKTRPTRLIVMFHNLALYKSGQAGDRMFSMDNYSVLPVSPRQHLILIHNGAKQLYYHYGKVNYAYRWCMEDMVEYGMRVQNLKYMVRTALMNGEWALAAKYNAVLKQSLFHRQWAAGYQKFIDNPELMTDDAEFKAIRPLMAYQNLPGSDGGVLEPYIMNSFAFLEGGTPEMLELSLQCNLVFKNIERFWPRFFSYVRTHERIPVHYQEAALLYAHLEGKVDVSHIRFDPAIVDSFHRFLAMSKQYVHKTEEYNRKAFKRQFGHTFWYYYFFITDIKTN
jgi:hypothetical protein